MDELDLLKELGREIGRVDADARARALRVLEERIRTTGSSPGPSRTPRRRTRPSILAAAFVAVIALSIAAIQVMLPPGSGGPGTAQATLGDLALKAGATESSVPDPGSYYLYIRSSGFVFRTNTDIPSDASWSFIAPVSREKWLASDGSGRVLERYGKPIFVSSADRMAWRAAGSPELIPSRDDALYEPGGLSPRDLGAIPLDPSSLADLISSGGVAPPTTDVGNDSLGVIAALLGEVSTSPELRSSLFLATAELPGIESLGRLSDPTGRVGTGIGIVESGVRTELIFDGSTTALLSSSVARVDSEGSPTQILSELTYEVRSIVTSTHGRPR